MSAIVDRRRYMGKKGLSADSYIQDGLVFQLDGIDKGSNDGYWTDLVGGIKFGFNYGVTENKDNVYFSAQTYLTSDKSISCPYNSCTIEVVCTPCDQGIVFMPASDGIAFGFYNNHRSIIIRGGHYANMYDITTNGVGAYSVNRMIGIQNGIILNRSSSLNNWGDLDSKMHIGGRNSGWDKAPFKGNLYSIRIYSRLLTMDEMLFNQHIDNVRFNLGLDI